MASNSGSGGSNTYHPVSGAFVWYLNIGGIYATVKEARRRKAAAKEKVTLVVG